MGVFLVNLMGRRQDPTLFTPQVIVYYFVNNYFLDNNGVSSGQCDGEMSRSKNVYSTGIKFTWKFFLAVKISC